MTDKDQKKAATEVIRLNETVGYQESSIVSRTLIEKKTGTVTIFAFDEGQSLSEHTAPFDAFVHITEGNAEITVSGRIFKVKEGEMIVMPAGEPHSVRASGRFKMMLVLIKL